MLRDHRWRDDHLYLTPTKQCGNDERWFRLERNEYAVIKAAQPGTTLTAINGIEFAHHDIRIDDIRLTNAVTVEHNTLGPGVIGHIMRHRTIDPSTMAATDRWFHYDQVGSILCETNSSGTHAQRHDQDAFGNTLDTWQNGLIGGDQAGWHHNTKEMDADTGLVYMYQRWFSGVHVVFLSRAPFPVYTEHHYTFAAQNSTMNFDPDGRKIVNVSADSTNVEKLDTCLEDVRNSCSSQLKKMMEVLDTSKTNVSADYGNLHDAPGVFDPNTNKAKVDPDWFSGENGAKAACAAMVHELRHAFDHMHGRLGIMQQKGHIPKPGSPESGGNWNTPNAAEFMAMDAMNLYRRCVGLPDANYRTSEVYN